MKNTVMLVVLASLLLGSCNFLDRTFNKKKRQRELLEQMQLEQARADSIQKAEEFLRQVEQARLDSLRMAEEAELAKNLDKYYVIAGSFKVPSNANAYHKKMECLGYDSQIIDGKSGFSYVSIGSFKTLSDATKMVKKIRDKGEFVVWVHRPH